LLRVVVFAGVDFMKPFRPKATDKPNLFKFKFVSALKYLKS
jgi:hypothetical protein